MLSLTIRIGVIERKQEGCTCRWSEQRAPFRQWSNPRVSLQMHASCIVLNTIDINGEQRAHNDNFMFSDTSALCALPRGLVCCYLLRI